MFKLKRKDEEFKSETTEKQNNRSSTVTEKLYFKIEKKKIDKLKEKFSSFFRLFQLTKIFFLELTDHNYGYFDSLIFVYFPMQLRQSRLMDRC